MANELAYGFVSLEDLLGQRLTDVGTSRVFDAIRESAEEHSRTVNAMLGSLVERTTDHQKRYALPGSGTLQPLDADGNPRPVRPSGNYDVAFPIQGGGDAWGSNRVSRALMTVEEANRHTLDALRRDADWMKRHLLAALFDNATWTYDDPEFGSLTIQPLANGDTVEYVTVGGTSATDNHFLAQANAIDDADNPFPTIRDELLEHPSNIGATLVAYVPSNLRDDIEGLTSFVEVNAQVLVPGSSTDTLSGVIDRGFGDEVLGFVKGANVWIVEWRSLPDNYMIAHARGAAPVLAMREWPAPELQGFFPENHSPDGNHFEARMIRYAGFGALNRVGALAYRIGNGSYAIPSGYDAPLSV